VRNVSARRFIAVTNAHVQLYQLTLGRAGLLDCFAMEENMKRSTTNH
jgi:hypothetical protein